MGKVFFWTRWADEKAVLLTDGCFSFGAVLEEFEVRDALEAVFAKKDPPPMMGQGMLAQQVAAY